MKLLFVISDYPPFEVGGYELRCKRIVEMVERVHDVTVLTSKSSHKYVAENNVYRMLMSKNASLHYRSYVAELHNLLVFKKVVREKRPDIIVFFALNRLTDLLLPWTISKSIPCIVDDGNKSAIQAHKIIYRISSTTYLKSIFIRTLGICVDSDELWRRVVVCSNSMATKNYAHERGAQAFKEFVVYPGIEIEKFSRSLTSITRLDTKIILLPGRVAPERGTIDGIDLLHILQKKGFAAKLWIVGDIKNDSYAKNIQNRACELGVESNVEWFGYVSRDQMPEFYAKAQICFLPSYLEPGCCNAVLEAMASGAMVVGYSGEGISELVKNGKSGYVVRTGDYRGAAEMIVDSTSNDTWVRVVRRAREQVVQEFNMQRYLEDLQFVWHSVVQDASNY